MADSIAKGIAYTDAAIVGGKIDATVIGATTPAAATVTNFAQSGAASTTGFAGATPVVQRVGAILTATGSLFATTGASFVAQTTTTVSGVFGLSSVLASSLFDSLIEIRAMLVALGLHKGGA